LLSLNRFLREIRERSTGAIDLHSAFLQRRKLHLAGFGPAPSRRIMVNALLKIPVPRSRTAGFAA
jgi:hypothetical protein